MRVCIDIDGVLAEGESNWPFYSTCKEVYEAANSIQKLLSAGHYIIIYTSRFERDREVTKDWLLSNGILFDRLVMEKPFADVYVDDKAYKFENWEETCEYMRQISKE